MNDGFMRHFISLIGTLICLLTFYAGYRSGVAGVWWTGFAVIVVYIGIFSAIDV